MNTKTITPAELADKENPTDGWYIIEAAGNHPQTCVLPDGQKMTFVQELTAEVLAGVAAAGVPDEGLYIDCEHEGEMGGSSAAMGWLRELAMCGSDLAGRIEWTPAGRPLIQGKMYKHFSTVYPGTKTEMESGTVHPTRLKGLTLTNRPNNAAGQPAITNTEPAPAPANPSPANPGGKDQTQNTNHTMNPKILAALGATPDASEEEVLKIIEDLKQGKSAAEDAAKIAAENEAKAIVNSEEKEAGVELTDEEKKKAEQQIIMNSKHGREYTQLLCRAKAAEKQQPARKYPNATPPAAPAAEEENPELSICNTAVKMCNDARAAGKPMLWNVAYAKARNAYRMAHPKN